MLFTTTIVVIVLIIVVTVYLWKLKSSYNYFKVRGIPGPPPHFFFGHSKSGWLSSAIPSRELQKWTRQFGSIYGIFLGTRPMYIVSNVEFLEQIFVKQFSSFHSGPVNLLLKLLSGNRVHLFDAVGERWRHQRHTVNPTFSNAKLKLMSSLVDRCIQSLMDKVKQQEKEQEQQQFNIYVLYKRMTMDIICESYIS
jgi:cytochrome P450